MTEARANEIFRTKYPEGEIVRKNASSAGWKYFVVFKHGGKVYEYGCTSYQQLLGRFGFNIAYKHDIENAKEQLSKYEKQLEDAKNGKFQPFAFVFVERTKEAEEEEIKSIQKEVNEWKEELRYLTEECIIDNA